MVKFDNIVCSKAHNHTNYQLFRYAVLILLKTIGSRAYRPRQRRPVHGILHYQRQVRILGGLLPGRKSTTQEDEGEGEEEEFLDKT